MLLINQFLLSKHSREIFLGSIAVFLVKIVQNSKGALYFVMCKLFLLENSSLHFVMRKLFLLKNYLFLTYESMNIETKAIG